MGGLFVGCAGKSLESDTYVDIPEIRAGFYVVCKIV